MTQIIIPLAGPDTYQPDIKPLRKVEGKMMIRHVLDQRPWIANFDETRDQLIFVLREDERLAHLKSELEDVFPGAMITTLPGLTRGASFSALAGLSMNHDMTQPVIIDLADIRFSLAVDDKKYFRENPMVTAIVPYFVVSEGTPAKEKYSYLELAQEKVLRAREKEVISKAASAGVYLFRDADHFLEAMRFSLSHPELVTVNGNYFVCPMVNGLISIDREVHGIEVDDAVSYSA